MESNTLIAVIDIGSIAIRVLIAEVDESLEWRTLDRAERPVSLGRDVFGTGFIARETINQSLGILRGYREMLEGWRIEPGDVEVIATSALREARNRDTFVDRVMLRTGFQINVIEGIEESRLTYIAVRHAARERWNEISRSNAIILEVGGGSTEIMLLKRGKMVSAHSMNIGTARIEPRVTAASRSDSYLLRYLEEHIRTTRGVLETELSLKRIDHFIAVGSDARLAAAQAGSAADHLYSVIDRKSFVDFVEGLRDMSVDECVHKLQVSYNDAEALLPSLLMYRLFLESTSARQLIVPQVSIREGLLLTLVKGPDLDTEEEFNRQIVESALSLGRRYHFDEDHAVHVSRLALSLFDQLPAEHGLGTRCRLLLHVSGILHDIGTFVKTSSHHKHGQYIIMNSEIFGLHRDDFDIVSNVVRYHRKSKPMPQHISFISLSQENRIIVMKLAALLRVADALDRSHTYRIKNVSVETKDDEMLIRGKYTGDVSVERLGLVKKADLFEDVFGMQIVLE